MSTQMSSRAAFLEVYAREVMPARHRILLLVGAALMLTVGGALADIFCTWALGHDHGSARSAVCYFSSGCALLTAGLLAWIVSLQRPIWRLLDRCEKVVQESRPC